MNLVYPGLILLQVGVIIFFVRRGRAQAKLRAERAAMPKGDTFEELRRLALGVTPYQLKLAIPDSQTLVFGIVMDWNMGDTVVTLASYITGAANLYLSTGGGVKGGGKNPNVGEAAVRFVTSAQELAGRAVPAVVSDLPPQGSVRFYLLTNKHTYAIQEQVQYFDDASSPWLSLFEKGNEVITEMKN
jgi:hypothetical protein